MKHLRRFIPIPILLIVALALAGGCGASQRHKTIATTLQVVNAGADAFVGYDQDHRTHIVAEAKSHAEGQALLNDWDGVVGKVQRDLTAAYKAIATAATIDDDPSLAGMVSAALLIKTELTALGVLK